MKKKHVIIYLIVIATMLFSTVNVVTAISELTNIENIETTPEGFVIDTVESDSYTSFYHDDTDPIREPLMDYDGSSDKDKPNNEINPDDEEDTENNPDDGSDDSSDDETDQSNDGEEGTDGYVEGSSDESDSDTGDSSEDDTGSQDNSNDEGSTESNTQSSKSNNQESTGQDEPVTTVNDESEIVLSDIIDLLPEEEGEEEVSNEEIIEENTGEFEKIDYTNIYDKTPKTTDSEALDLYFILASIGIAVILVLYLMWQKINTKKDKDISNSLSIKEDTVCFPNTPKTVNSLLYPEKQ